MSMPTSGKTSGRNASMKPPSSLHPFLTPSAPRSGVATRGELRRPSRSGNQSFRSLSTLATCRKPSLSLPMLWTRSKTTNFTRHPLRCSYSAKAVATRSRLAFAATATCASLAPATGNMPANIEIAAGASLQTSTTLKRMRRDRLHDSQRPRQMTQT